MKYYVLIILFFGFLKANAQKIYRTEEGHVEMMARVDSVPFKAEGHKLALYLDFDSKVVSGVLDLKTLSTNNPEIKAMLAGEGDPLMLRFTGTVPSADFLSKRHDPIDFNWLIDITYQGKAFKSQFKATITHIEQGLSMSCLISAKGQVIVTDTGLDSIIKGMDDTIEVQFAQMILELDNQ